MIENWKHIKGYSGYMVSDQGRVKSLNRLSVMKDDRIALRKGKILKPCLCSGQYFKVNLSIKGQVKSFYIHKLVAITFLNHKPSHYKEVVNHINHKKTDNRLKNLEVISHRENCNQKHLDSSSNYVGVHWSNKRERWVAAIRRESKKINLGGFEKEIDAHYAYQNALSKIKFKQYKNEMI
jgi:hypothetical protein